MWSANHCAVLLLLHFVLDASAEGNQPCPAGQFFECTHSVSGGQHRFGTTLSNTYEDSVDIFWISFSGDVLYDNTIAPGEVLAFNWREGITIMIRDTDGNDLGCIAFDCACEYDMSILTSPEHIMGSCQPCPDNTYKLAGGVEDCVSCDPSCPAGFEQTGCKRTNTPSSCDACAVGFFKTSTGEDACSPCPAPDCAADEYFSGICGGAVNTGGCTSCQLLCPSGYEAVGCGSGERGSCQDLDECAEGIHDCPSNSICRNTDGSFECDCEVGYVESSNSNGALSCVEFCQYWQPCDIYSVCSFSETRDYCTCNAGYFHLDPLECGEINFCEDNPCHPHASCVDDPPPSDSGACACNAGYNGDGVVCVEIDFCSQDPCDENAKCTDDAPPSGSGNCTCNAGYTGDGMECVDVDECQDASKCDLESAHCSNLPGGFNCSCLEGFQSLVHFDGAVTCYQPRSCTEVVCGNNATCTSEDDDALVCRCDSGFEGDGDVCTEIDFCSNLPCHRLATCSQSPPPTIAFNCTCNAGYTGDGFECGEINFCDVDPCHPHASCVDDLPPSDSGACVCNAGYNGDGVVCAEIDFCSQDPCDENAKCTDDAPPSGSGNCTCNAGYTGDGMECVDVDECSILAAACDDNALCTNTPGGFNCTCMLGFVGSGEPETCTDVDECDDGSANCDTKASCTNLVPGFSCTCNEGYTDHNSNGTCVNVNECAGSNTCDETAICTDTDGSYQCSCRDGYTGDGLECRDPCTEAEGSICHVLGYCEGYKWPVALPGGEVVPPAVSIPKSSDGRFFCRCFPGLIGHGYGADGCDVSGHAVRVVFRGKETLSVGEELQMLELMGGLDCKRGFISSCDHVHYQAGASGALAANVLFRRTEVGKAAAERAATAFNDAARRRSGSLLADVDVELGARVYTWDGSAAAPLNPPAGMEVSSVRFEPACASSGCWTLHIDFTVGHSEEDGWRPWSEPYGFNTFYLPYAVGSDDLSFDFNYPESVMESFLPAMFPCRVSDYDGSEASPSAATVCCFGDRFDTNATSLGGSPGRGLLGNFRVTEAFKAFAEPFGALATCNATVAKDFTPDYREAMAFFAEGQKFVGLPNSPGIVSIIPVDPYVGMYKGVIKLDEKELRTMAGLLSGSVSVEHTVDFFLGYANFKPASGSSILDSLAAQTAIHLEKTSFFSVSTQGTNDYTFLQYVNLRLVMVLEEDTDFSGAAEAANRTVRTDRNGHAGFLQVTFTMGKQYQPNMLSGGLIPLDSVRAGLGTFFDEVDGAGEMHLICSAYDSATDDSEFGVTAPSGTAGLKSTFDNLLSQPCAPQTQMCASPSALPDGFVAFNVPLGFDVYHGMEASDLSSNVFVDFVVNAIDTDAVGEKGDAMQMKTTLSASIPIVSGGVNIFCDGVTAKTDLKDVANADILVGTASSGEELTRLRILQDIASSDLEAVDAQRIDTASIESALMTLVLKGNHSYFTGAGRNTLRYTVELDDVVSIHLMEDGQVGDAAAGDGSKQGEVLRLLAMRGDDNSDSNGLDTDGYALNGAFYFTVDRATNQARLMPSAALTAACPLNPPQPVGGNAPLESCIVRLDVRQRSFPNRIGAAPTAMEVLAAADPQSSDEATVDALSAALDSSTDADCAECSFLAAILGESAYTRELAVRFARSIHAKYRLNGRFRRAFWVNPGYEWTPTQTAGRSLFAVSQQIYLFALVSMDEHWTRRRMLLQSLPASDALAESGGGMHAASLSFAVSPRSMLADAFDVPTDRVAAFTVSMSLTAQEACLLPTLRQAAIRDTLADYLARTASAFHTVQVSKLTVDLGAECAESQQRRRRERRLLASAFSTASATLEMLIVFHQEAQATFNAAAFSNLAGILSVEADSTNSPSVLMDDTFECSGAWCGEVTFSADPTTDAAQGGSSMLMIASIAGAAGGALIVIVGAVLVFRERIAGRQDVEQAVDAINVARLKAEIACDA